MLRAYIQKAASALLEFIGRLLIFNRHHPAVAEYVRDVRYASEDPRKQALDVAVPEGQGPFPVLVHIHGGGWHFMDKKSYVRIAKWFAHRGYLVFNIDYRLAPGTIYPEQVQDVARAVRWAYDNAGMYGGDNSRVFLVGDSAGAYFAGLYATTTRDPELAGAMGIERTIPPDSLKGLLLFYGAFDMEDVLTTGFTSIDFMCRGFFGKDPEKYRECAQVASPIRHLDAGFPPSFICSGERDKLHSQSVSFDRALTAAGVPHRVLFFEEEEYPEAFHGFLNAYFLGCARLAMKESLEFMADLQ